MLFLDLSFIASLNELYTSLSNKALISLIFPLAKDVIIVSYAILLHLKILFLHPR